MVSESQSQVEEEEEGTERVSNARYVEFDRENTFTSHSKTLAGSLMPSHGLPPFGANITNITMSEGLCGSSMFGTDRWGVNPMTAGERKLFLSHI